MKRNGITLLALLLAAVMLLVGCGAKKNNAPTEATAVIAETPEVIETAADAEAAENATQIASPIHEVADYNALLTAVPDVLLADAPKGSTNVTYSYIDGTPVIAQIQFTLDGNEYTYRGAATTREKQTDISGVYDKLDKTAVMVAPDSDELIGGEYELKYAAGSSVGVATWYYEPTECQYCVYTPTGCDVSQGIVTVVKQVMPIASTAIDVSTPSGKVEGATVVSAQDGEMIVNTADGKTLQFDLSMFSEMDIKAGDVVDISYYGDLTDWPLALTVEKSAAAAAASASATQVSGTVYSYTNTSVYVSTDSGMVYGFVVNADTKFTGQSATLKAGNSVTVTYTGTDLASNVVAATIETTNVVAGKDKNPSGGSSSGGSSSGSGSTSLENKRLTGYVTYYNGNQLSMQTGSGHEFTFRITSFTSIYGHHNLGIGSRVRVVYDGYASDSPAAKKIEVYSGEDPNPTPNRHTMNGYLISYSGTSILIDTASGNQHDFTITSSTNIIGGGQAGAPLRVTYIGAEDGDKIATKIVFE